MTQQPQNEAFDAIVAPLAAERTQDWTMNGFGDLYISERDRLVDLAARYTKDRSEAEDIVQDAFVKCAIAAPDLANRDHAVAYLTRTVVNTALNVVKAGSRRAMPVEDVTELDSRDVDAWNPAADDAVMRAADTALVTEALSRLTDAQRTALLMTASGDYSTKQVAEALGVSEQQVYTHVSRARAALRRALESIVVDPETGMTAADQLSHVVTKAKKNAKQVGQTVAAIFLVMAVGLGLWNFNSTPTLQQITNGMQEGALVAPKAPSKSTTPSKGTAAAKTKPAAKVVTPKAAAPALKATAEQIIALRSNSLKTPTNLPGTDANGLPVGFRVFDAFGNAGEAIVNTFSNDITMTGEIVTVSDFITVRNGVNVMVHQTLTWKAGELTYVTSPMVRVNGAWMDLPVAAQASERQTLPNGDVVITTHILVDTAMASASIAGPGMGIDAQHLPASVIIRIHTSQSGMPVYGQVVQVIDPLQGSSV